MSFINKHYKHMCQTKGSRSWVEIHRTRGVWKLLPITLSRSHEQKPESNQRSRCPKSVISVVYLLLQYKASYIHNIYV